jgi:hypothetical protein
MGNMTSAVLAFRHAPNPGRDRESRVRFSRNSVFPVPGFPGIVIHIISCEYLTIKHIHLELVYRHFLLKKNCDNELSENNSNAEKITK